MSALTQEKRQLTAELAAARKEAEQLKSQLAGRSTASAELTAAQNSLRETQATLAKQSSELATARGRVTE